MDDVDDLFRAHYPTMVGVARLLVGPAAAEEVVQEAFVRLIDKRPGLRDPERAAGYLRQTVVNLARGRLRRRVIGLRLLPTQVSLRAPQQPDEAALHSAERERLAAALHQLPPRQRECLVLRHYAGLTEPETAAALGIAVGSVKSHVHRALSAMEAALEVTP